MEVAPVGQRVSLGSWGEDKGDRWCSVLSKISDSWQLSCYKHAAIECMRACPCKRDMCVCVTLVCECVRVYGCMCLRFVVVWALASWDISLKSVLTLIPRLFFIVSLFLFLLTGSPVALGHFIPVCSTIIFFFLCVMASMCSNNLWKPSRLIPVLIQFRLKEWSVHSLSLMLVLSVATYPPLCLLCNLGLCLCHIVKAIVNPLISTVEFKKLAELFKSFKINQSMRLQDKFLLTSYF